MPDILRVEHGTLQKARQEDIEESQDTYFPCWETRTILARQEEILQNAREDILEVLRVRFENGPNSLEQAINQIDDDLVVKTLHRQPITIRSLEELQQRIIQLTSVDEKAGL